MALPNRTASPSKKVVQLNNLPLVFFRAGRRFDSRVRANLARRGVGDLSTTQSLVLMVIQQEATPVKGLVAELGVSRQALHRLSRGLQALGLVEVVQDGGDRRARLLRLTDEGAQVARTASQALQDTADEIARGLGRRRAGELVAALETV